MDIIATAKAHDPIRLATERLVFALLLALIFLMAARTPLDGDLFWHIKAGEQTVLSGSPVVQDVFSHTRLGEPWTNHSWLAQVVLYGLWQMGSWLAVGGWVAATVTLIFGLLFHRLVGPFALRVVVLTLAAVTSAPLWTPRPQLFSLLFLVLLIGFMQRRGEHPRQIWLLPIFFCLWSNLHGGYILGLIYLGVCLLGDVFNSITVPQNERAPVLRAAARLAGVGLISFAATAINPNGLRMWLIPFQTVRVDLLQQLINEWASPDFHDPAQMVMLLFSAIGLLSFSFTRQRKQAVDVVLFLVFAGMAFTARRNIGPYALVAAPILCRYAADLPAWGILRDGLKKIFGRLSGLAAAQPKKINRGVNLVLFGLVCFAALLKLYAVTYPGWVAVQTEKEYPLRAVLALQTLPPAGGNLFNEYNDGGYLIFALPSQPVFVDGRTDLFGDEILADWLAAIQADETWEQIFKQHQIGRVLIAKNRPLAFALAGSGWRQVYADTKWVIYER